MHPISAQLSTSSQRRSAGYGLSIPLATEGDIMRSSQSPAPTKVYTGLMASASTIRSFYHRAHDLIASRAQHKLSIERVISDFLSALNQTSPRTITEHLSPKLAQKVRALCAQIKGRHRILSKLSQGDLSGSINGHEVLLQYKQPFSRLGLDQYLVYIKLELSSGDRHLALWVQRSVHSQTSWKIEDFLIHNTYHKLSLGISDGEFAGYAKTIRGQVVNDSILTALFFTRFITGSCPAVPRGQIIDRSQRCNDDFANMVEAKTKKLLHTLHHFAFTEACSRRDPLFHHMVKEYKACATGEAVEDPKRAMVYHLLSLSRVPSSSEHVTRVLAHIFVPSVNRYFSVWFSRSALKGLTWNIDDFYIHRFGSLRPNVHADKQYCTDTFRTLKTRVFYTPDLIGDALLRAPSSSKGQPITA